MELYERVEGHCYDLTGEVVADECCGRYKSCREDVTALGRECAANIQKYMHHCELLPTDVSTEGGEDGQLKIVNTTRLCSAGCQMQTDLISDSSLRNLEELEARCAPHLERVRMMVKAEQHFAATWVACASSAAAKEPMSLEPVKVRKPRWGPVEITTRWVPPVLDLKAAFETMWTALPCTYSDEFHIAGTVGAIQEELLLRPDLPISCPSDHVGRPVNLVVAGVADGPREAYDRAVYGSFATMSGLGVFGATSDSIFRLGGEAVKMLSTLASNPSKFSLDKAVDYMMDHVHRTDRRSLKKFWRWLSSTKTAAFLTLGDPVKKNYLGATVRLQCNEMSIGGKSKHVATWVDAGDMKTVVTAKHLAFLITRLA